MTPLRQIALWGITLLSLPPALPLAAQAQLLAGAARVDITDRDAGPVNDPSYVKALVFRDAGSTAVILTVDAVAIGELGRIGNGFLPGLRSRLRQQFGILPSNVIVNASHCHSVVRKDVESLALEAVRLALDRLQPARAGAGRGREERIMENRRLRLKDGSEADVRRAYSLPPDQEVAAAGPVDPEIGLLRVDTRDGKPLAVLYNFAAHPIQGVPGGGNTADYPGFASRAIEETLGEGVVALFVQGCAGDINPVRYKDVHHPPDAEILGNRLGLSVLRAWKSIRTGDAANVKVVRQVIELPRGADLERRMAALRAEQTRLLGSLQGTSLNFDRFVPLYVQYALSRDFPSYYSHGYLHEQALGIDHLKKLDAGNRAAIEGYIRNIRTMEQLTRLQTNLELLQMHHRQNLAAGRLTLDAEVVGMRIGEFVLVTFPGELSVEIGLGIKRRAPNPFTFVAGYTNGYIYYTPTARQRNNTGYAQEDCDSLVAPEWQSIFEERVRGILQELPAH